MASGKYSLSIIILFCKWNVNLLVSAKANTWEYLSIAINLILNIILYFMLFITKYKTHTEK